MPSLRRIGFGFVFTGLAIAALIPIFLIAYPAAGVTGAAAGDPAALLRIAARAPLLFAGPAALQVAGHAVGALAILALWFRFGRESVLVTAATLGGLAWMVIDVVDNAVTMQVVPTFAAASSAGDASAASGFATVKTVLDALRLAGHFGGGLWVVGISIAKLRTRTLHPSIGWAGLVVGVVLAANPFVPPLLNLSFLSLPLWLVVFGIGLALLPEPARSDHWAPGEDGFVAAAAAAQGR